MKDAFDLKKSIQEVFSLASFLVLNSFIFSIMIIWECWHCTKLFIVVSFLQAQYLAEAVGAGMGSSLQGFVKRAFRGWMLDGLEEIYEKHQALSHLGKVSRLKCTFFTWLPLMKDCKLEDMLCWWYFGWSFELSSMVYLSKFFVDWHKAFRGWNLKNI